MSFTLRLADRHLLFIVDGVEKQSRPIDAPAIATFKVWRERSVSLDALFALGREIGAWIDETRWMASLTAGGGPLCLDIAVGESSMDDARAYLDVPWELLTTQDGFLAADAARPFFIQRRIGHPRHDPERVV